jgi:alpha-D-ribose 1-methylphosphonate 5-triphosphate diphosphatase PhnM|tara:strand:- start:170 stop:424 length:255 start_codon:yes stop_codon:yes gene_type:complete
MADYTITLTDTEVKSLKTVMSDVDNWITNAATNRARIAKNDIISKLVAHCNANDIAIATGEDAQVTQAYDLGLVEELTDTPPSL